MWWAPVCCGSAALDAATGNFAERRPILRWCLGPMLQESPTFSEGNRMFERIIWFVVAVVLTAMAVSLWADAWVAALGAGALAAYSAVSAIRGRCFGDVCMVPVTAAEPVDIQPATGRE